MFSAIKQLLGFGPKIDYAELLKQGAIIVDVRSAGEFASGHIPTALNIPVDQLANNLSKLKDKNQPIITCCASGMRSASARSILLSKGYTQVVNGGGWAGLRDKLMNL